MPRIVIFANGEVPDISRAGALVRPTDAILCADGGSHYALALGLQPSMVIGDLDSMQLEDRRKIESAGIPVRKYSPDKDETDLELALRHALEQGPSSILIIAALGRRLDQTLGNLALLSDPALSTLDVRLDDGLEQVLFCRRQAQIEGGPGDVISLMPWGGVAEGVRTVGLKWPLHAETLYPEKTRGISNEMLESTASVALASGLLLIIHRRQAPLINSISQNGRLP